MNEEKIYKDWLKKSEGLKKEYKDKKLLINHCKKLFSGKFKFYQRLYPTIIYINARFDNINKYNEIYFNTYKGCYFKEIDNKVIKIKSDDDEVKKFLEHIDADRFVTNLMIKSVDKYLEKKKEDKNIIFDDILDEELNRV